MIGGKPNEDEADEADAPNDEQSGAGEQSSDEKAKSETGSITDDDAA